MLYFATQAAQKALAEALEAPKRVRSKVMLSKMIPSPWAQAPNPELVRSNIRTDVLSLFTVQRLVPLQHGLGDGFAFL